MLLQNPFVNEGQLTPVTFFRQGFPLMPLQVAHVKVYVSRDGLSVVRDRYHFQTERAENIGSAFVSLGEVIQKLFVNARSVMTKAALVG